MLAERRAGAELTEEQGLNRQLPLGWEYIDGGLTCPCGDVIELDGACSGGHVSPLMKRGLI